MFFSRHIYREEGRERRVSLRERLRVARVRLLLFAL